MSPAKRSIMRDNPPTAIANDGTTVLRRYRVDAVIYARNITEARRKLREADLILDDALIVPPSKRSRS